MGTIPELVSQFLDWIFLDVASLAASGKNPDVPIAGLFRAYSQQPSKGWGKAGVRRGRSYMHRTDLSLRDTWQSWRSVSWDSRLIRRQRRSRSDWERKRRMRLTPSEPVSISSTRRSRLTPCSPVGSTVSFRERSEGC
jgi:hypothetical protein